MRSYTIVIERDADTGGFVGHVPRWPGAHSQGDTIAELQEHWAKSSPCCSKMANLF